MRKNAALAFLVPLFALASCGGEEISSAPRHAIDWEEGEGYLITNLPESAMEGDPVYFDLEVLSVFYKVDAVYMNGEEIFDTGIGYRFTMPTEDALVTVETSLIENYDDPEDNLSWGTSFDGRISEASESDKGASWDVTTEIPLLFHNISSGSYVSSIEATIDVSDPDVIPLDAIDFVPVTASTGNSIVGGYLEVDLKQVKAGECLVYLHLDPNNSSLGTLIRKIEVVPYGELKVETMEVEVTFENRSSYQSGVFVNISDQDYIYGSDTKEIHTVWLDELTDGTYAFDYAIGHTYLVSAAYYPDGATTMVGLHVNDWVGTNEGGASNHILDGYLVLETPGASPAIVLADD